MAVSTDFLQKRGLRLKTADELLNNSFSIQSTPLLIQNLQIKPKIDNTQSKPKKNNTQKDKEIDNQANPTRKMSRPTIHDDIMAGLHGVELDYEAIDKREKRATLGFRKAGAALGSFGETALQAGKDWWANTFENHEDDEARKAYNKFLGRWNQFQIQQAKGSFRTAEDVLGMSQKEAKEHLDYLKAELDKVAVSTVVDSDSYFQKMNQEIEEDYAYVTEDMTDGEKAVFDLYMTASEMVPVLAVGAVNPVAGGALAAGMAGGHKTYEVNAQGIAATQSFQRGVLAGAIEAATEAVPIGKIAKLVKGPSGKKAVRAIFEQMGTEATEESISYIANYVADKAYQDPNAKFSFVDLLKGAGAGMILGGVFSGAGVAVGNTRGLTQTPQANTTKGKLPHAKQTAVFNSKQTINSEPDVKKTGRTAQGGKTTDAGSLSFGDNSVTSNKGGSKELSILQNSNQNVDIKAKVFDKAKGTDKTESKASLLKAQFRRQIVDGKTKFVQIEEANPSKQDVTSGLAQDVKEQIDSLANTQAVQTIETLENNVNRIYNELKDNPEAKTLLQTKVQEGKLPDKLVTKLKETGLLKSDINSTLSNSLQSNGENKGLALEETKQEVFENVLRVEGEGNLAQSKIDEIVSIEKGLRPNPSTYLQEEYITKHFTQFDNGVTKIAWAKPTRPVGSPGGTFVMPKSVADDLIAKAGGDARKLEELLGLNDGDLGDAPVRIDIDNPSGLRMPDGNELGANEYWIPGGHTRGGIPEAIIDQIPLSDIVVTDLFK